MANRDNITTVRSALFLINLILIVLMSAIIYDVTATICRQGEARHFLEKVQCFPMIPWQVFVYSILLLGILSVSMLLRETIYKHNRVVTQLFCVLDVLVCVGIMYCFDMSYRGILYIAITNMIMYIDGYKRRAAGIFLVVLAYVLLDYDILSAKLSLISFNDYVQCYDSSKRLYLFGIRNVLSSLNEVVFILFMMLVIQQHSAENTKIKKLYEKLYHSTDELKIANIQLQEYARKSDELVRTKERNRLAREIHDTIGHTLTSIAIGLEACIELLERDIAKTKLQMIKIAAVAKQGLVDVRRSVKQLRPDTLEKVSLIPAIEKLAEDINECTKTKVVVAVHGQVPSLSAKEEETIYRIVQEGITNAVRHGNARIIDILLVFTGRSLHLEIADNGSGCTNIQAGFGLRHIRERVTTLNGEVVFHSGDAQAEGFMIIADLPVGGGNKSDD